MDFGKVFAAPVKETIAGVDVVFPLLTCEELAPFTADIRADRVAAAEKLATAQKFTDIQVYQAKAQAHNRRVTVTDVIDRMTELDGSDRVCRLSLSKAGMAAAAIDGIMRMVTLPQRGGLALKIACVDAPLPLFLPNEEEREIQAPLAVGATGTASGTGSPRTPTLPTHSPASAIPVG